MSKCINHISQIQEIYSHVIDIFNLISLNWSQIQLTRFWQWDWNYLLWWVLCKLHQYLHILNYICYLLIYRNVFFAYIKYSAVQLTLNVPYFHCSGFAWPKLEHDPLHDSMCNFMSYVTNSIYKYTTTLSNQFMHKFFYCNFIYFNKQGYIKYTPKEFRWLIFSKQI